MSTTYTRLVQAGADDVHYYTILRAGFANILFGVISGTAYHAGFRFTGVTIPQGATINSAKITFEAYATLSGTTCKPRVFAVDADNFGGFADSAGNRPSDVAVTTAYADWTVGSWTDGTSYDTPEIKTAVQEVIDRDGWSSGNAMSFVLRDVGNTSNGAYRSACAYENGSGIALLTINYESAAGPANLKTYNTNATANIKTINTNAIANVKSLNTNT